MKFGMLEYRNTGNLGDEIQSLAARRLLPRVECYLDRDDLGGFAGRGPVALIVHGWFGHTPQNWPPAPQIHPLLISLHLSETPGFGPGRLSAREFFMAEPVLGYLKAHAPVGARDLATAELLDRAGVPAYFSGCLSLTFAPHAGPRTDAIVVNDVPNEVASHIRARARRPVVETAHGNRTIAARADRFAAAEALLATYAGAHCVVTTRLHCALPCLAFGTPVLLIDTQPDRERFSGIENYYRHCGAEDFLAGRCAFDWEQPEANRGDFRKLASVLEERVAAFVAQAEAGGFEDRAPAMDGATLLAARNNTLVALHARAKANEQKLRAELAAKERELERLRRELAQTPGSGKGGAGPLLSKLWRDRGSG